MIQHEKSIKPIQEPKATWKRPTLNTVYGKYICLDFQFFKLWSSEGNTFRKKDESQGNKINFLYN